MKIIKDYFLLQQFMIDNIYQMIKLAFQILLIIHCVACGYVFLGWFERGWIKEQGGIDDFNRTYVDNIYFIATTMTTVGYGDISATGRMIEKFYIIIVELFGIMIFSII